DRSQPSVSECTAFCVAEQRGVRPSDELPGDAPIDQPNTELERARPVRTAPRRTTIDPRIDVHAKRIHVYTLTSEHIRLGERWQMQVAIRFPQILDIAHQAFVPIIERARRQQRRVSSCQRIPIPARWMAQLDLFEVKDRVTACEHAIRRLHIRSCIDACWCVNEARARM